MEENDLNIDQKVFVDYMGVLVLGYIRKISLQRDHSATAYTASLCLHYVYEVELNNTALSEKEVILERRYIYESVQKANEWINSNSGGLK